MIRPGGATTGVAGSLGTCCACGTDAARRHVERLLADPQRRRDVLAMLASSPERTYAISPALTPACALPPLEPA